MQGLLITGQEACNLLQACTKTKSVELGRRVYSLVIHSGLDSVALLNDHLIRFFAYCGCLFEANKALGRTEGPTPYTWSAIISANAKLGQGETALCLHCKMSLSGIPMDKHVHLAVLKACTVTMDLVEGRLVHARIMESGFETDHVLGNTLIDMYAKSGSITEAHKMFLDLQYVSIVSWNAIITGHAQHENALAALGLFMMMLRKGMQPNRITFLSVFKACGSAGDVHEGRLVHSKIIGSEHERNDIVWGCIIGMYVKCDSLEEAQKLFQSFPHQTLVLWNGLYAGYAQHGKGHLALELFAKMQLEGIQPDRITFLSLLKACSSVGALVAGRLLHYQVIEEKIESDIAIGNSLVDMYAKSGSLEEGQTSFEKLAARNIISWSAMIGGYAQQKEGLLALGCYERMQQEGINPGEITFFSIMKTCAILRDKVQARLVHEQIINNGTNLDDVIASSLIDMYAKCRCLNEAQKVFDCLPKRHAMLWSVMIDGCTELGESYLALEYFQQMQQERILPNAAVFTSVLRACTSIGAIDQGRIIHYQTIKSEVEVDVLVGTSLIDMYAKSDNLEDACKIFNNLPAQDVVSWGAMLTGYARQGKGVIALECFEKMQLESIPPNKVIFLSALRACCCIKALEHGRKIHYSVMNTGIELDTVVGSSLIEMYIKCGSLGEAQLVFNNLPDHNVVCWGAILAGYIHNNELYLTLKHFLQMQQEGIEPDVVTFWGALLACAGMGHLEQIRNIHEQVICQQLELNAFLGSALIKAYAMCWSLEEASKVFYKFYNGDVILWYAMVSGYTYCGESIHALKIFEEMQQKGMQADKVVFLSILKACGNLESIEEGRLVHQQIINNRIELDIVIGSCLINMYAKCGSIMDAQKAFESLPHQNVVSWGAMIGGFVHHEKGFLALENFERMQQEGIKPDAVTYLSILKACASMGFITQGRLIHNELMESPYCSDMVVNNTLVDMYAKCGCLVEAHNVFDTLLCTDVVSWGAIIAGYAQHGETIIVLEYFDRMKHNGIQPDKALFTNILVGCCRTGLVDEGRWYFKMMIEDYGFTPTSSHCSCMVDLLGHAGYLTEAEMLLKAIGHSNIVAWTSLFGACNIHGNVEVGGRCFDEVISLDSECVASYVLMSNLYAEEGLGIGLT